MAEPVTPTEITPERRRAALAHTVRVIGYPRSLRRKALEKLLREFDDEVGCCDEFPECSHVLDALAEPTS